MFWEVLEGPAVCFCPSWGAGLMKNLLSDTCFVKSVRLALKSVQQEPAIGALYPSRDPVTRRF